MRWRQTGPLGLLGILLFPARGFGDLDVAIPPGSPLEWRYELPLRRPDPHRGPVYRPATALRRKDESPKEGEKPRPAGSTVVLKPKVQAPQGQVRPFGSFDSLGAVRILTVDITSHLAWTRPKTQDAPPGDLDYPPRVRTDLHWLIVATLLRPLMHPARTSVAETLQYLILIGHPVVEPVESCQSFLGAAREQIEYLKANVPRAPTRPPPLKPLLANIEDPEKRMLIRWASRELTSDHLYAYNPSYARRILSLGDEASEILLACCRSDHSLLKANAAGILASFDSDNPEIREELLRLMAGRDAVARARALEGLARIGDPQAAEFLIKALRARDPVFKAYAIHLLGGMGAVQAVGPVQGVLKIDGKDRGDLWLAAASALSRLPDPDGSSAETLINLARAVERSPRSLDFDGVAFFPPDIPDQPGERAKLVLETITIALARLRNEKASKMFLSLVEKLPVTPPAPPGSPPGSALYHPDPALGGVQPLNQLLAIETLASMDRGQDLCRIVKESSEPILRSFALSHLVCQGKELAFIEEVAADASLPSTLRVQALEASARLDAKRTAALKVAASMVESYLKPAAPDPKGLKPDDRPEAERVPAYECLSAVRILGKHSALSTAKLVDLLREALARGDYERFTKGGDPPANQAGPPLQQITLKAFPPLYEALVVELGRAGGADAEAEGELIEILGKIQGPARAEAAAALGKFKTRASSDALIAALSDKEAWVRYVAYRALREISGESHFADWLFGSAKTREAAIGKWKAWRVGPGEALQ
jgi:HEAT repeat protein